MENKSDRIRIDSEYGQQGVCLKVVRMNSKLLTARELADYLGKSKGAIYVMCYRGQLPYVKIGTGKNGAIRFDIEKIQQLVKGRSVEAFESKTEPGGRP